MNRSLSEMTIPELYIEHKKMVDAIARLNDTEDETGKFQLAGANALKFAIECQIKNRVAVLPVRSPHGDNILDFVQCKRRIEARRL